jgi:predicted transcriptional regulator
VSPEPLAAFLFEVASPERLLILSRLSRGDLSHTEIARQLGRSGSETSRHLQRLRDVGLIVKGPHGKYSLTTTARVFYAGIPFFEYLVANQDYLRDHDLGALEPNFLVRLGELSRGTLTFGAYGTVAAQEGALVGVRERIWLVADEGLEMLLPTLKSKLSHGVDVRVIRSEPRDGSPFGSAMVTAPLIAIRTLKDPGLSLTIVDDQAWIRFPTADGAMDRSTMILLRDPTGLRWAEELFQHYWNRASAGFTGGPGLATPRFERLEQPLHSVTS